MIEWNRTRTIRHGSTVTTSKCGRFGIVRREYCLPANSVVYFLVFKSKGLCAFDHERLSDAKEDAEEILADTSCEELPEGFENGYARNGSEWVIS